jgi:glycosyltransferase involved in cell wall biosynthesis
MSELKRNSSIDVMVPFYGDVTHLFLAVESVRAQTLKNWHMTVVDDGYPDESIHQKISDLNDSRITYIRNDVNLGANGNYKKCIELSTADLVVMMGADDEMLPNYLEIVTDTYRDFPYASMFHPDVKVIDENGQPTKSFIDAMKKRYSPKSALVQDLSGEDLAVSLIKGNWTYFPAICWRRDQLVRHNFRSGLNVTQDLALLIDQTLAGAHLIYVPITAFKYRRHLNSDSSIRAVDGQRFVEESKLFNDLSDEFLKHGWKKASRSARLHLSSRANALFNLPRAIRRKNLVGVKSLFLHIFAR